MTDSRPRCSLNRPVSHDRRRFLNSALWSTAALPLLMPRLATAGDSQHPIVATPLGDNLFLLTGAGANVVATSDPDGLVLVDGGLEKHSKELLKTGLQVTKTRSVTTLFNTHWHPEQTGSNETFGKRGAKIISHVNTKLWLTRRITVGWRPGTYGPFDAPALPAETFYSTANMTIDAEHVDYGYLAQAHTDGDIYVFFRKANVLVGGGVVSGDRWPVLDYETGGWIAGIVAGLDSLIKLADDQTRIVPADGPVLTRADLQAQRAAYFSIYERLVKCLTQGLGPAEAIATDPAQGINPQWGDPQPFLTMAFKSLWGHLAPDA
jgi:glyoxylase-like metal-dependent hydrolase (beta-lactamase superfamily II)